MNICSFVATNEHMFICSYKWTNEQMNKIRNIARRSAQRWAGKTSPFGKNFFGPSRAVERFWKYILIVYLKSRKCLEICLTATRQRGESLNSFHVSDSGSHLSGFRFRFWVCLGPNGFYLTFTFHIPNSMFHISDRNLKFRLWHQFQISPTAHTTTHLTPLHPPHPLPPPTPWESKKRAGGARPAPVSLFVDFLSNLFNIFLIFFPDHFFRPTRSKKFIICRPKNSSNIFWSNIFRKQPFPIR